MTVEHEALQMRVCPLEPSHRIALLMDLLPNEHLPSSRGVRNTCLQKGATVAMAREGP
jgi:hypothetical protein